LRQKVIDALIDVDRRVLVDILSSILVKVNPALVIDVLILENARSDLNLRDGNVQEGNPNPHQAKSLKHISQMIFFLISVFSVPP
jgi:hypothetical protein